MLRPVDENDETKIIKSNKSCKFKMFPSTIFAFKTTHATTCPRFCCFIGLKDLSGTALVETLASLGQPAVDPLRAVELPVVFPWNPNVAPGSFRHDFPGTGISRPQSCEAGRLFSRTFRPIPGFQVLSAMRSGNREGERDTTFSLCILLPSCTNLSGKPDNVAHVTPFAKTDHSNTASTKLTENYGKLGACRCTGSYVQILPVPFL